YYFNKSLGYFREINMFSKVGVLYNNIGAIYYYKGYYKREFKDALNYYFLALKINEEIKDTVQIIVTLDNLGLTFCDLGDFAQSKKYLYRALALADKINNPDFSTLSNLARNFAISGSGDSALVLYKKILSIAQENKDVSLMSATYNS